jgi:hypothetical protein
MSTRRLFPPVLLALLAASLLAMPAHAQRLVVGIGDQKSDMFSDPRFAAMDFHIARRVVAWDALRYRWQRAELDEWMDDAQAAGVAPLVSFARSRVWSKRKILPSPARFRAAFRAFKRRYPWVRTYSPWNEVNHCSQPTCHNPRMAARYYKIVRAVCPGCRVVAADVLDDETMVPWLRAFLRYTRVKPRLWGLHPYLDANRFHSSGTRTLLRTVRGEVWFTEVGGLVRRQNHSRVKLPDSAAHAAAVTRFLFRLARVSPRISRMYLYNWNARAKEPWDSAFIGPTGHPRPAFGVLEQQLARWGKQ